MTRSELLDVVYRFYPRGVPCWHRMHVPPGQPVYDDTEEHLRLVEAARRAREEHPTWKAMTRRLGDRHSLQDQSSSLLSGDADPAYSARIWIHDDGWRRARAISFHVSALGPYYGSHGSGALDEDEIVRDIAREIEATYPGYRPIPPELGNEIVPDVEMNGAEFGQATIYICIFSKVWTWGGLSLTDV